MKKLILFIIMFLWVSTGWGATYYVDNSCTNAGDGTAQTCATSPGATGPWKTIASVNGATFLADDQILFHKGQTWTDAPLIPPSAGSSNHQIIFSYYGTGTKPKIDATGKDACIYDSSGNGYITTDGLELANANLYGIQHNSYPVAGTPGSTPNWIVKNCTFTNCGLFMFGPNTIIQDNTFNGPSIGGFNGALILGGAVNSDCQILRNTITGYAHRGIWISGKSTHPTISDNVITNCGVGQNGDGFGIDIDGADTTGITGGGTVSGNIISGSGSHGIAVENWLGSPQIVRNWVHDYGDTPSDWLSGIEVINYDPFLGTAANGTIAYNVIYNGYQGIHVEDVSYYNIWNNTLYAGTRAGGSAVSLKVVDSGSNVSYLDFRNNILVSNWPAIVPGAWAGYFSVFDYNIFPASGSVITEATGWVTHTLASLQVGGYAIYSSGADPVFSNPLTGDFRLLPASPARDVGIYVGLVYDYRGYPVPVGSGVDVGAYEFVATTITGGGSQTITTGGTQTITVGQ